jgi:hypothetical protein
VYGINALGDHPLAADIAARMQDWAPFMPNLAGFSQVSQSNWGQNFSVNVAGGAVNLSFDPTSGGLTFLSVGGVNVVPAGSGRRHGYLVYVQFNDTDFNAVQNCPVAYARQNEAYALPNSSQTEATLVELWAQQGNAPGPFAGPYTFLTRLSLPSEFIANVGAPADIWVNVTVTTAGDVLHRVLLFNKTATRLGEATVFVFEPVAPSGASPTSKWWMDKLSTWVDPQDVAVYGGARQHSISTGIMYFDPSLGPSGSGTTLFLRTIDAPVVAPGTPTEPWTTLPFSVTPPDSDAIDRWAVVLHTNTWIMNYAVWSLDADYSFRFALEVGQAA